MYIGGHYLSICSHVLIMYIISVQVLLTITSYVITLQVSYMVWYLVLFVVHFTLLCTTWFSALNQRVITLLNHLSSFLKVVIVIICLSAIKFTVCLWSSVTLYLSLLHLFQILSISKKLLKVQLMLWTDLLKKVVRMQI